MTTDWGNRPVCELSVEQIHAALELAQLNYRREADRTVVPLEDDAAGNFTVDIVVDQAVLKLRAVAHQAYDPVSSTQLLVAMNLVAHRVHAPLATLIQYCDAPKMTVCFDQTIYLPVSPTAVVVAVMHNFIRQVRNYLAGLQVALGVGSEAQRGITKLEELLAETDEETEQ